MADLIIKIRIPEAEVSRYKKYFKSEYLYQENVKDPKDMAKMIKNPESIIGRVKRIMGEKLVRGLERWEKDQIVKSTEVPASGLKVE